MTDRPNNLQEHFSRESLPHELMRDMYDYWSEARGKAPMPPLSAIDPMQLPRQCLPYLSVLEVEQEPFRLRNRLSGTAVVEQFGENQTGKYLDELPGTDEQLARMEWCVREQRPYVAEDGITFAPNDYKTYQILILPFGDPGRGVRRILGVFCFPEELRPSSSWTK